MKTGIYHPSIQVALLKNSLFPTYSHGADGPGNAEADLVSRCNRDKIPYGLVAIHDDRLVGTTALDVDVSTNLTPSVVGLLVRKKFRYRGIATALLETAVDRARLFGYQQLYVSTAELNSLLQRLGWKGMGDVEFLNNEPGSIYVREL